MYQYITHTYIYIYIHTYSLFIASGLHNYNILEWRVVQHNKLRLLIMFYNSSIIFHCLLIDCSITKTESYYTLRIIIIIHNICMYDLTRELSSIKEKKLEESTQEWCQLYNDIKGSTSTVSIIIIHDNNYY